MKKHGAFICIATLLLILGWVRPAHAQIAVGEWVRTDAAGGGMTMTVAACCKGGYRLTYRVPTGNGQPPMELTVDLAADGTEAPTMSAGKPTGQMMSLKRVDDRHYTGAMKMNGQTVLTNTVTISADGKSIAVEDTMTGSNQKTTETWARK